MRRLLIANRGEIAVRIIRTAHELGYETVAVYSEPDRDAPHVQLARYSVALGGQTAAESYLDVDKILRACKESGAEMVHPGYGFLSEQAHFARALKEAGLTFVGPSIRAIEAMGSKMDSKRLMEQANVPCVPGYHGDDQSDARLTEEADRIGYPIMVKASAGGGGKGMRLVHEPEAMPNALRAARSEARNAFGDDTLLLEKAIVSARHIEIQVFADTHGEAVYLFERDCSVQRRHQKVIEEAPAVGLSDEVRRQMGEAAVAAARSIDYVGAGTVEFLLLPDGETFYFLEMNTRLQVEHPVTEMITGIDLVAWQLEVAEGGKLPLAQEEITRQGHAMEVRIYAEDPYQGFLPQSGRLAVWEPRRATGVRVDSGVRSGQEISPFYDPMLAKIIASGKDRETARKRLVSALEQSVMLGTRTNLGFLIQCLEHDAFRDGGVTTDFIKQAFGEHFQRDALLDSELASVACAYHMQQCDELLERLPGVFAGWSSTGWRSDVMRLRERGSDGDEQGVEIEIFWGEGTRREVTLWRGDEATRCVLDIERAPAHGGREEEGARMARWRVAIVGEDGARGVWRQLVTAEGGGGADARFWVQREGGDVREFEDLYGMSAGGKAQEEGSIHAPMSGKILDVRVSQGDVVKKGAIVMVLEAMKMEHELTALKDGKIEGVYASTGDQVAQDVLLVEIVSEEEGASTT